MAFSRVKPAGWAVNEKLTSAQMNALDTDHANALDKTTAGDELEGVITMAATAKLRASTSGAEIAATTAGAKIKTATGGRIELGDSDYPTLPVGHAGRSRSLFVPCTRIHGVSASAFAKAGAFTAFGPPTASNLSVLDPAQPLTVNTASAASYVYLMDIPVHAGATLASVAWKFQPVGGHSGLPAYQPWLRVFRVTLANGSFSEMLSTGAVQLAAANVGAFQASQTLTATLDQNNTSLDPSTYRYLALLGDEGHTNALANSQFFGLVLSFTNIVDMRFP